MENQHTTEGDLNLHKFFIPSNLLFSVFKKLSASQPIVFRLTGGYVRDQILSLTNKEEIQFKDLDVSVENASLDDIEKEHSISSLFSNNLRRLKPNPQQFKFLETLRGTFEGCDVEILPLRKIDGCGSELSPAAQDAYGRDFTINVINFK